MNAIDSVESSVQKFVFELLREFGVSFTIVIVILMLTWKVFPELIKVLIDKYRAETDLVRETQKVVVSFPSVFAEMKTAIVAEIQKQHSSIKEHIETNASNRIEAKVDRVSRAVSHSEPDNDPPPPTRNARIG